MSCLIVTLDAFAENAEPSYHGYIGGKAYFLGLESWFGREMKVGSGRSVGIVSDSAWFGIGPRSFVIEASWL